MPETEQPAGCVPRSQALFTVHVSKRAGWVALLALVLCALIVADIRSRSSRHSAPAQNIVAERKPVTIAVPDVNKNIANEQSSPSVSRIVPLAELQPPKNRATPEPSGEAATVNEATAELPGATPMPPIVASAGFGVAQTTHEGIFSGAGSTFPDSIYSKWFAKYHELHPEVLFNYQAIGSGGGVRRMLDGTADFGASDVPVSDDQLSQSPIKILHIPTVLGAVVPIYNVPGVGELRFTPEILAGIFLGKILSWNDAAITKANPGLSLPNQAICVIHRSDGNTSNFIFTDYLSKVSGAWQEAVGKGTSVKWPVGLGGKGNEGVAAMVRQIEGAIGYIDLLYAEQSRVPFGSVKNMTGRFVRASLDSVTEAAASVREMPADFRVSITNAPGSGAYPIASYTWLLVPEELDNRSRAKDLAAFLTWMANDGQAITKELGYAPLPRSVAAKISQAVAQFQPQ